MLHIGKGIEVPRAATLVESFSESEGGKYTEASGEAERWWSWICVCQHQECVLTKSSQRCGQKLSETLWKEKLDRLLEDQSRKK